MNIRTPWGRVVILQTAPGTYLVKWRYDAEKAYLEPYDEVAGLEQILEGLPDIQDEGLTTALTSRRREIREMFGD